MDNIFGVWKTMYEEDFNTDCYLYHYTNVSKAFKILYEKKLKFSKLNLMNDTLEAKPKLAFDKHMRSTEFQKIINRFSHTNNNYLQLLCMSKDGKQTVRAVNERHFYSDYSGRGFALPRMWAQYASNNNGVCFIFNKKKLISIIQKALSVELIHNGDVKYLSHFEPLDIDLSDVLEYIKEWDAKSELVRNINELDFFKKHKNFVEYNYFSKLNDWEGENEYRFLAYGDKDYYISNIFESIVGIVVGEAIETSNLRIIQLLCDDKFEIMKIAFNCAGCNLENINDV